jgi:transposase-like protein
MADAAAPFVPPHCPRSDCRFHHCAAGWRWKRHGSFTRQASPRRIPRFRCGHCGHTFSSQSFATSYWLKRPDVLVAAAFRLLACSGYRQLAREARCSPTTVMRHAARLGRHALLYLQAQRPQGPLQEPVVGDGFESFAHSQYQPLHLNLVVGAASHFCYAFTHTELRRKGRMTAAQKRRRARLEARHGRPDPRGIERGMALALELAVPAPQQLVCRSDEHDDYPRAVARLARRGYVIHHQRTSSREARTAGNPLFPVNRLDLLLRHNSACHKRETIAFAKRHQAVVERAAWLLVWQNFTKPFSERRGGGTPAMRLGLTSRPIPIRELLSRRLFPARVELPAEWARYYRGEVVTRSLANERRHRLQLAA